MSENTLPLEIERKFLIALPDAALLGEKSVKRLSIAQVYLRAGTSGAAAASAAPAAAMKRGITIPKRRASPP